MLINIKSRLQDSEIQELLGYSTFPDPDALEQAIESYKTDAELQLYGYESEGYLVGLIGFRMSEDNELTIVHLAVKPDSRGAGFGRGQILEVIELMKPDRIIAETDEEAVEFYRSIGFVIASLGEKYPGVERFICTYDTEENED